MSLTRDLLREKGFDADQIELIMAEHGKTLESAKTNAAKKAEEALTQKIEALSTGLAEIEARNKDLESANNELKAKYLSAEELAAEKEKLRETELQNAAAEKAKYVRMQNELEASKVLSPLGLQPEALSTFVQASLGETAEDTIAKATAFASTITAERESAAKAHEAKLLEQAAPLPRAGGSSPAANPVTNPAQNGEVLDPFDPRALAQQRELAQAAASQPGQGGTT